MDTLAAPAEQRPVARRGKNRRAQIIEVATACFYSLGYAGTTMSTVFERMGGSRSTLYGHFSSKDELFIEVLRVALEDYRVDLSGVLTAPRDGRSALFEFCEHFLARLSSPDGLALHRLLLDATRSFNDIGRLFLEQGPHITRGLLADFMREQHERGEIDCRDPDEAAEVITSLCMGGLSALALWGVEQPDAAAIRKEANRIADIVFYLYRPGSRS